MKGDEKLNMQFQIDEMNYVRYDYLNYCRYVLLDIIKYADEHSLTTTTIPFKNDCDRKNFNELCKSEDEKGMKWLLDNGYENIIYDYAYKHVFFSLIVDFSNFYSVSIEQAFAGNIAVAWSLLRRPLQETLAYIDWLSLDKHELIKRMLNSDTVDVYDLTANKELRKNIVNAVYKYAKSEDFDVYSFRYDKKYGSSLDGILNGATHLITTYNKYFKTVPSSLNFVFNDKEGRDKCVNMYFTGTPFIMHYAMNTIMKMFGDIADLKDYTLIMNEYNLRLKNLQALQTMSLEEGIDIAEIDIPIYCPKCGNKMETLDDWKAFAYKSIKCKLCENEIDTFGYIFDFEEIDFQIEVS